MLGKTYKQMFHEWKRKNETDGSLPLTAFTGAEMFAKYLDGFRDITPELQVLAMTAGKEIDRECMKALIAVIGQEKAAETIKPILARFHKTK